MYPLSRKSEFGKIIVMKFVKEILWAAIEDYTGLWQTIGEIEAVEPKLEDKQKKEYARKAIEFLFLKDISSSIEAKHFSVLKLKFLNQKV